MSYSISILKMWGFICRILMGPGPVKGLVNIAWNTLLASCKSFENAWKPCVLIISNQYCAYWVIWIPLSFHLQDPQENSSRSMYLRLELLILSAASSCWNDCSSLFGKATSLGDENHFACPCQIINQKNLIQQGKEAKFLTALGVASAETKSYFVIMSNNIQKYCKAAPEK